MFAFFKCWQKKLALKKEVATKIRELNIYDELELLGQYTGKTTFEAAIKELNALYLQRGLSQTDVDRIIKKVSREPIYLAL